MRHTRLIHIAVFLATLLCAAADVEARSITLVWDANAEPSVAGYMVYYGMESGTYTDSVDVGNLVTWQMNLPGGQYYFAVRAYDADGNLSPFSLEVADAPGVALANPGDQFYAAGATASLQLTAIGSPLAYSAVNLPPGLSVDPATGRISGTFLWTADASIPYLVYVVTARASDASGGVSSVQFYWTVRKNVAPAVTNPGHQSTLAHTPVILAIGAADYDGDALTYSATGLPIGLQINARTGVVSGMVPTGAVGTYQVTVAVSDGVITVPTPFAWTISAPGAMSVDQIVSVDGGGSVLTTRAFSTSVPGETLIAFVTAAQPSTAGVQTAFVTGGDLAWTLVTRANNQAGTAEIWKATASTTLSDIAVTASVSIGGTELSLTIVTFRWAAGVGAFAAASAESGAPLVSLTTTKPDSFVYGAGNDWDGALSRTLGADQALVHEALAPSGDTFWVQNYARPTGVAGSVVQLSDTEPTTHRWNFAAVEIVPQVVAPPSVTASPAMPSPATAVTATVADGPGNPGDWVGLFEVAAESQNFQAWQYLNGTQTPPAAGLIGATVSFPAPHSAGLYHVRLFAEGNSTTPVATSNSVLVPSTLAIDSVSVVEGNSGTTTAVFTVTLTPASPVSATVTFATSSGSATAGSDYVASAGSLTFAPGATTQTITVAVMGDLVVEPNETFMVTLRDATNAAIGIAQGVGTIANDDVETTILDGRMFGVGRIDQGRTRQRFVFRVGKLSSREYGRVEFWSADDRGAKDDQNGNGEDDRDYGRTPRTVRVRFESTAIRAVAFSDDPAFSPGRGRCQPDADSVVFSGAGKWNGKAGYTFEVRASDRGEPGRQRDTFSLVVKDSRGGVVANVSGTIASGNIQSTRVRRAGSPGC